jgi:hypothetical protein
MTRTRPILSALTMVTLSTVATDHPAGARQTDTRSIAVQVVDAQRHDMPHIPVQVIAPGQSRRQYTAGTAGVVSIPVAAAVEGAILIASQGRKSLAWFPLDAATPAGPGRGQPSMMLLPLTHRIDGTVLNRAGKPVAGVRVGVEMLSHPINQTLNQDLRGNRDPLLGFELTDDAGRFSITIPEGAQARLRALHARSISPAIEVTPRTQILNPTILEPTGAIRGRLTDATAGKPVARAMVAAQLIENRPRLLTEGWGQAVTDDRGGFLIEGLEPGVYNVLLLEVPGGDQATARAVEAVRVRAGDEATADLAMIEGKPLRGVVIDRETDRPMAGAMVGCQGPSAPRSGAAILGTKTDARGRFTFPVPPGEQLVTLIDDPSSRPMSRRIVVVPDQGEIMPISLLYPRGASSLSAAADESAPVAPLPVVPAPAVAFVAAGPAAPVAEVRIVQEAIVVPAPPPVPVPAAPAQGGVAAVKTTTKAVRAYTPMAKFRTVTGRVTDAKDQPMAGVRMAIEPGAVPPAPSAVPNASVTAVTDQKGTFELAGVPHQKVPITLSRPGEHVQKEALPADRDDVTLTYRPTPDEKARHATARVEDEPIPPALHERLTFVDLTPNGNNFLSDGPGNPSDQNNLDRLPRGVHKLGDAYFGIGDKMAQVKGQVSPNFPASITGIKVAAKGKRLHFLHACQQQTDPATKLGHYDIHYADGSRENVPIVYGKNLVDWWHFGTQNNDPSDARIAWTGSNPMIEDRREGGLEIHLFAFSWTNPHPDQEIATIDVVSSLSQCDPFVIAVTLEREN